jgi:integrase
VAEEVVATTLPHLPAAVAAMVKIQRLTGCRPAEVCAIRPADIDRSGAVWEYVPRSHKTAYCGKGRMIFLGPKAQALLLPWLLRDPESYCFSPHERVEKWNSERKENRKSPMTPSQRARRRKRRPCRAPGD